MSVSQAPTVSLVLPRYRGYSKGLNPECLMGTGESVNQPISARAEGALSTRLGYLTDAQRGGVPGPDPTASWWHSWDPDIYSHGVGKYQVGSNAPQFSCPSQCPAVLTSIYFLPRERKEPIRALLCCSGVQTALVRSRDTQVPVLALTFTSCLSLGRSLHLSEPQLHTSLLPLS